MNNKENRVMNKPLVEQINLLLSEMIPLMVIRYLVDHPEIREVLSCYQINSLLVEEDGTGFLNYSFNADEMVFIQFSHENSSDFKLISVEIYNKDGEKIYWNQDGFFMQFKERKRWYLFQWQENGGLVYLKREYPKDKIIAFLKSETGKWYCEMNSTKLSHIPADISKCKNFFGLRVPWQIQDTDKLTGELVESTEFFKFIKDYINAWPCKHCNQTLLQHAENICINYEPWIV